MTTQSATRESALHRQLATFGFRPVADSGFRRGHLDLTLRGRWGRLTAPSHETDPFGYLGRPGPWKLVQTKARLKRVCDLPPEALALRPDFDDEAVASGLDEALAWALAALDERFDDGWLPPPRGEIEGWLSPGRLSLQIRQVARQANLIHASGRWSLRVPVLLAIPPDLSPPRISALRELLVEIQDQWRLVRTGFIVAAEFAAAVAEVDFSGLPQSLAEAWFTTGWAALKAAVEWSVSSAELLADASVARRLVESDLSSVS